MMPSGPVQAAQEAIQENVDKGKALARDAARTGSYLYPLKGLLYFAYHPSLWDPLLSHLVPTLGLSAAVVSFFFFFTYFPQLAVLVFVNGPLAIVTTGLLVLNESAVVVSFLSQFLLRNALVDTFDATLVARDANALVARGRRLQPSTDPVQSLGKLLQAPGLGGVTDSLVRYVVYLPLNMIPFVGTIIFILLQGRSRGRTIHDRYFQLKGWSSVQRENWAEEHAGAYAGFGTVATLFEMVPFASLFFSFTNTVGAALWAADMEANGPVVAPNTAPNLRQAAGGGE